MRPGRFARNGSRSQIVLEVNLGKVNAVLQRESRSAQRTLISPVSAITAASPVAATTPVGPAITAAPVAAGVATARVIPRDTLATVVIAADEGVSFGIRGGIGLSRGIR